jgi:hypothetical protein
VKKKTERRYSDAHLEVNDDHADGKRERWCAHICTADDEDHVRVSTGRSSIAEEEWAEAVRKEREVDSFTRLPLAQKSDRGRRLWKSPQIEQEKGG